MAYSRRQRTATASGKQPDRTASAKTSATSSLAPIDDPAMTEDLSAAASAAPALERKPSSPGKASNRRVSSAGRSGRQARASAPRKALTPEQQAARKVAWRTIGIILGCVCGLVLLIIAVIALTRPDEKRLQAKQHLERAELALAEMKQAIVAREPDRAQEIKDTAIRQHLQVPVLGGAVETADPATDPQVASREQARRAAELLREFVQRAADIDRVREERLVELNRDLLLRDFARLKDAALNLDDLERRLDAFEANPVEPAAGPNLVNQQRFTTLLTPLLARRNELSQERQRRLQAATTDVSTDANRETDLFIRRRAFAEALRWLQARAAEKPDADLSLVRAKVEDSARGEWAATRLAAEGEWRTGNAQGTHESQREGSRERARALLRSVAAWGDGIEPMTSIQAEAKALLAQYGG